MRRIVQTLRLALFGYDWKEEATKMMTENRMALAAIRNLLIRKGVFKEEEYDDLLNKIKGGIDERWRDYKTKPDK